MATALLASHRDDPEYVGFAIALGGLCCCAILAVRAWKKLRGEDPPPEAWGWLITGFACSLLITAAGTYLLAELQSPSYAAKALLMGALVAGGVFSAFIVALALGMAGHGVLAGVAALAILVLMGYLVSQIA